MYAEKIVGNFDTNDARGWRYYGCMKMVAYTKRYG